ncbi:hypothetical protein COY23_02410 [bacterium (Candidatus Torokbacteria) CG_4_10_14_0_2_um_filter_35_8]|nr:MAG: hypothetical protein COY23_02410 [bacterium (Candidatus Torokbacteria) CG_4_10_14_0_2_um_filter_35_8]
MNNPNTRLVVFDLETTNNPLKNYRHEIIEIAGMEIVGSKINSSNAFYSLVRPPCKIQPYNYRVSGISDSMVKDAPAIGQVLPGFLRFIKGSPLVGHNVAFDARVLNRHLSDLGNNEVSNMLLDTLTLSRKIHKKEKLHSLDAVMKRVGIKPPRKKRHRALEDVEYTAMVFLRLLDILKQYDITTLEAINRLCNTNCEIEDFQQPQLF